MSIQILGDCMQYFTILLIIRISSKTSVLTKNTSHSQSMQPFLDTTNHISQRLGFPSTVSRVGRGKIDRSQQYLQYMVYRVSKIKTSHQKSFSSHKAHFVKSQKVCRFQIGKVSSLTPCIIWQYIVAAFSVTLLQYGNLQILLALNFT